MHHSIDTQTQITHVIQKLKQLLPEQINEVEDFVDFLKQKKAAKVRDNTQSESFTFPVDHVGGWPEDLSLSRQDFYDDNGR